MRKLLFLLLMLIPTIASATTYYVAKTCSGGAAPPACSDANNGTGIATAKLTIQAGIGLLSPGDTLQIRVGTYHEELSYPIFAIPSGTAGNPITMMSYPGETATIDGLPGTVVADLRSISHTYDTSYWVIKNLKFDGRDVMVGNITIEASDTTDLHISIENNDITGAALNGVFVGAFGVDILDNQIYDGGHVNFTNPPYGYCIYYTGAFGLIDGNDCHHFGRYGMQFYTQVGTLHDNVISNNKIHDNGVDGGGAGLLIGGTDQLVYNNLIYNNNGHGMDIDYGAPNHVETYFNTIYGNTGYGIVAGIDSVAEHLITKNNIIYNNAGGTILDQSINPLGTSNNLFTNPNFVTAGSDFHLTAGSAADNAGVAIMGITTDYDGVTRGNPPDIGAYEVVAIATIDTFYVAKTGSDANTCTAAKVSSTPKLSIASGMSCMGTSDTLIIGNGTYVEAIDDTIPSGVLGAPTIIQAASPNGAILRPSGSGHVIRLANRNYITLDGLVADAVNLALDPAFPLATASPFVCSAACSNIILKNGTFQKAGGSVGVGILGLTMSNSQILNNLVQLNNWDGISMEGASNLISGNTSTGNGRYGISLYNGGGTGTDSNILKNNIINFNGGSGILLSSGSGNLAYNNLIYDNTIHGIEVNFSGLTSGIYYNTIFRNGTGGGMTGSCVILSDGTGALVRNNICYLNNVNTITLAGGTGTTSNNTFTNPLFQSEATPDFHILTSSPAISAGVAIAGITADYDNVTRGSPPDVGAYEFIGPPPPGDCSLAQFLPAKAVAEASTAANVILQIPPCPLGVAWNQAITLTIPATATSFTLAGAGSTTIFGGNNQTVLIDNYKPGPNGFTAGSLLTINLNSTGTFRMYGITWQGGTEATSNYKTQLIQINGPSVAYRIDHNRFDTQNSGYPALGNIRMSPLGFYGHNAGVMDHNIFNGPGDGGPFVVRAAGGGNLFGDLPWSQASGFGGSDFNFFEDNVVTANSSFGSVTDCYQGGKYVIRFNALQGTAFGQTHPTGGSGRARGCRGWEIYGNTSSLAASGVANFNGLFMSSATGFVWGNVASGTFTHFATIHSTRATNVPYPQTATPNGWGNCGTMQSGTGSNWDQNTVVATGKRCLDGIGNGIGDLLTGDFPSVTNSATGCISTASCAWPRQALEPVYEWLNTFTTCSGCNGQLWAVYEGNRIAANSEYYNYTASFNGTVGVGSGAVGARPGTCTTGVGYWATNEGNWRSQVSSTGYNGQGRLYKCTSTNTWEVIYQPYLYPHPLVSNLPTVPTIVSVTPNHGTQGDVALSLSVVGILTSWVNATTVASFSGTGITVNSTTVTSPTAATLSITIAAGATLGNRALTMTTGAAVETASNIFTVAAPGTITSVTPSTGAQGATIALSVIGNATAWVNATTVATFSGTGITVNSTTVGSATTATVNITIAVGATLGARNLTMTTGSLVETGVNVFTVTQQPVISLINPSSGTQGDMALSVVITGVGTAWVNGTTAASFSGTGITVNSTTVASATSATLSLDIAAMATVGLRNLTMTTGVAVETAVNGFNILASVPPATIASVTPNTGAQNTMASLAIVGTGTSWVNDTTIGTFSGTGITTTNTTVTNTTHATLDITIAAGATLGLRNLTMTTGAAIENKLDAFTVTAEPIISSITPDHGTQGDIGLSLSLVGVATSWMNGVTVASFNGTGITVNSTVVASTTTATVNITIAAAAATGLRDLTMTTGMEIETALNGFTVEVSPPPQTIVSVTPNSGLQGATLALAVVGLNTAWDGSTVAAFSGSDITINSTVVATATTATVNVTIDPLAAVGLRNMTMTTGTAVATGVNVFNVTLNVLPTPTHVTFLTQPTASVLPGQSLGTILVAFQDEGNLTVVSATNIITIVLCPGSPVGILSPANVAAVAGVATFTGLNVTGGTGGGYTLCASSPGVDPDTSNAFDVTVPTTPTISGAMLPFIQQQYFNAPGPANKGGFVCTYKAGTTSPLATYSDVFLSNENQNPVRLSIDSGRPVFNGAEVQLNLRPQAYKIVVYGPGIGNKCHGTSVGPVISTRDQITGYNMLNATDFKLTGDATASEQLISTVATGKPPFKVRSTTIVDNLTMHSAAYLPTGVARTNAKLVYGTGTLSGATLAVTLTGDAAFTGATTYVCNANSETAANPIKVTRTSGSSVTFTGTGTDNFSYVCIGN